MDKTSFFYQNYVLGKSIRQISAETAIPKADVADVIRDHIRMFPTEAAAVGARQPVARKAAPAPIYGPVTPSPAALRMKHLWNRRPRWGTKRRNTDESIDAIRAVMAEPNAAGQRVPISAIAGYLEVRTSLIENALTQQYRSRAKLRRANERSSHGEQPSG